MNLTTRIAGRVRAEFARPTGLSGRVAGWIMASRASNRRRNAWTVSLLEVQRRDRVLEIGFGPGIAVREISRLAVEGYVCGLDHSEEMLRQATRRNAAAIRTGRVDLRPRIRCGGGRRLWQELGHPCRFTGRADLGDGQFRRGTSVRGTRARRCPAAPHSASADAYRQLARTDGRAAAADLPDGAAPQLCVADDGRPVARSSRWVRVGPSCACGGHGLLLRLAFARWRLSPC